MIPRHKIVAELLNKYIPGQPALINQYVPGAGGIKATNLVYSVARPDGLTIGVTGSVIRTYVLEAGGIKFDPAKFLYLGAADTDSGYRVLALRKELGVESVEKLRTTSGLRFGSQAVGHDTYIPARLFAYLLDLKEPRFITGYTGPETEIAFLTVKLMLVRLV
jgi:tripartite-type tricarboxylate transporter receptor subunit TctC